MRKRWDMIPSGTVERGERKQTAAEVSNRGVTSRSAPAPSTMRDRPEREGEVRLALAAALVWVGKTAISIQCSAIFVR